ncbi:MAG: hypothetical protein LBV28_04690 [Puniceicoccales bacterium]|jgi:hypothetical protein|nr:hypothetical protein [Puniceicoccales bacterium]
MQPTPSSETHRKQRTVLSTPTATDTVGTAAAASKSTVATDTAAAPETKQKSDDIVVFITRRDGQCAECGEAFSSGNWIRLEKERPLCMRCADLAHLEYLPPGSCGQFESCGL